MTTRELIDTFTREEGIALFNERKTDKEAYDLFVSKGLTDDFETFVSEAKNLFIEKISGMSQEEILKQIEGAELTDEQLEMIAGGSKGVEVSETTKTAVIATTGVLAAISGALGIYGAIASAAGAAV